MGDGFVGDADFFIGTDVRVRSFGFPNISWRLSPTPLNAVLIALLNSYFRCSLPMKYPTIKLITITPTVDLSILPNSALTCCDAAVVAESCSTEGGLSEDSDSSCVSDGTMPVEMLAPQDRQIVRLDRLGLAHALHGTNWIAMAEPLLHL